MGIGAIGAGAALASTAVSIGTSLAGSGKQSSDVSTGQQQANAAQTGYYQDYKGNAQPYISTGDTALGAAGDAAGLNGATGDTNALANFQASPGYQYQLQQGLSAIDNGAASRGTLRDGNTVRAEETLGSNLANQDFTNYYNRISGLAGSGLTATNALGGAGVATGAGTASTDTSAATANSNIDGNAAKGVGTAVTGALSNPGVQNALAGLGSSGVTGTSNTLNVGAT